MTTDNTALIEIDFQHWIIALTHDREVVTRAALARKRFCAAGAMVVCTRYLSRDSANPERSDPTRHGASFHPALTPAESDLILTKYERDVFTNVDLDANLRLRGVSDVVITGVATEYGVALAARSAHALGYRVSVVADACAGTSTSSHCRVLDELAADGITVI